MAKVAGRPMSRAQPLASRVKTEGCFAFMGLRAHGIAKCNPLKDSKAPALFRIGAPATARLCKPSELRTEQRGHVLPRLLEERAIAPGLERDAPGARQVRL